MHEHIAAKVPDERRACTTSDPARFIVENMGVAPVPSLPELRLYAPHAGTGLSRLGAGGRAPYWAFAWAGGLALAHYLIANPGLVAGRRVVDFGAGSGLVGFVAAREGASRVTAVESDAFARAAIGANAALNGVDIAVARRLGRTDDDLILAGDVFYAADVGRRALAILERYRAAGVAVLIGDPYRAHLPRERLRRLADLDVPDMGCGSRLVPSGVFALDDVP